MIQPVKSQGEYRKDFYQMFEGAIGRQMTDNEHKFLKKMMTDYLADHRVMVDNSKPHQHVFTCVKCRSVKVTTGRKESKSSLKHVIKSEKDHG